MRMKHRCQGHIHIAVVKTTLLSWTGKRQTFTQGVQDDLPMTVIDPFGIARRAGRIESGCPGIFIKIGELTGIRRCSQE